MVMRKAASMLELVIAIVIMGLAVMALPIILGQTLKNNEFSLQQEILLAARTKLGDILTYRWDEHSLESGRIGVLVTDGDDELNVTSGSIRRVGHIFGNKRRKFLPDLNTSTAIGNFADGTLDDIDDFDTVSSNLQDSNQTTNLDYRFIDFNMTTEVVYVSDIADYNNTNLAFQFDTNSSNATTNIKMITLKVTGNNGVPFILRTYSSNIGESEFLRRNY